MLTKATFLTGAAVGYVLGARAGRERYEQIVSAARRTWEDPRVQQRVGDLQETATAKGQELQDRVVSGAKDAASSARQSAQGGGAAGEGTEAGGDTVVLTTYDSATGAMETTTVDVSDAQAGSNGHPG